jgi:dihydrofolate reductase
VHAPFDVVTKQTHRRARAAWNQPKEAEMTKIVVTEFVSLDGVMEDPGGAEGFKHGGWTFKFNDPQGMKFKLSETLAHGSLLLGRVTYDGFAAAWPGRIDEVGFADKMNSMHKYVVSTTLTDPSWGPATVIADDVVNRIAALKEEDGDDILVAGSRTLVQTLLAHDLADEYRLMVFPIVLGSGKRLFGESDDATTLSLASSQALDSGTVILTYEPARTS